VCVVGFAIVHVRHALGAIIHAAAAISSNMAETESCLMGGGVERGDAKLERLVIQHKNVLAHCRN